MKKKKWNIIWYAIKSNNESRQFEIKIKKLKKKYNKNHKTDLRKSLQFLEIIEENQKWKYSIKFFNETETNIYYNCIDSN